MKLNILRCDNDFQEEKKKARTCIMFTFDLGTWDSTAFKYSSDSRLYMVEKKLNYKKDDHRCRCCRP